MNLEEWNAGEPMTKPNFNPVVYTLEAFDIECDTLEAKISVTTQDIEVHGRVTQEGGRTTPYSIWASTNEFKTNATMPAFALGTAVGSPTIPLTSLYPGCSFKIRLGGVWSTVGVDTMTINIANLAGDFTYATATIYTGAAATAEPWSAEFEIQIQALGAATTGRLASSSVTTRKGGAVTSSVSVVSTSEAVNSTTFSTAGGIYLAPYIGVGVGTSSVSRHLGYCVCLY